MAGRSGYQMITCGWCLEKNDSAYARCKLCGRVLLSPDRQTYLTGLALDTSDPKWTQGTDISTWQESPDIPGAIDFTQMFTAGARFSIIRLLHGMAKDTDFAVNWPGVHSGGMWRGAYHYLTWGRTGKDQALEFLDKLGGDFGDIPPVADYECRSGVPSSIGYMRQQLKDWLEIVTGAIERAGWRFPLANLTGDKPIIYTSPYYWLEYGSPDLYWKRYPLWIANYYVIAPYVPPPWQDWLFWQYTDKGPGPTYGVESQQIDLDWCSKALPIMNTPPPDPEPIPEPTMTQYTTISSVTQRTGHNRGADEIQLLSPATVLLSDSVWVGQSQAWAHVKAPDGRWGWCAICYAGKWYLKS